MDQDNEMDEDIVSLDREENAEMSSYGDIFERNEIEDYYGEFNDDIIDRQYMMPMPYIDDRRIVDITEEPSVPLEQVYRDLCSGEPPMTEFERDDRQECSGPDDGVPIEQVVSSYGKTDLVGDIDTDHSKVDAPEESATEVEDRCQHEKKREKTKKRTKKQKKKTNAFISFFLSMYRRRPSKRAADVARQAGRQWYRMSDRKKSRYANNQADDQETCENSEEDQTQV